MKTSITWLLIMCCLAPPILAAEDNKVRYQIDLKGGIYKANAEAWATYYGHSYSPMGALALNYALLPQLRVGVETGYIRDDGSGSLPQNNMVGGSVQQEFFPAWATVSLYGRFFRNQPIVPYVSAGSGLLAYSQYVKSQGTTRGRTTATFYRGGVQFVLDWIDRASAATLLKDYGVVHSYVFVEYTVVDATKSGSDLGGELYLGGFGVEFR